MTFNGKPINSEQQRTLYDDIKNDRCTRCHQKGHVRRNCPDTTPHKWEQRFDSQKANYWVSIAKWQDKATSSSPTGSSIPKETKGKGSGPPNADTKHSKQHHRNTLDCGSDSNDDSDPNDDPSNDHHQLQFWMNLYEPDSNATSPFANRFPNNTATDLRANTDTQITDAINPTTAPQIPHDSTIPDPFPVPPFSAPTRRPSYQGIPIAGEYDDDYKDDSDSSTEYTYNHVSAHATRRKLSKGQQQRRNRQLRKTQSRNERFAREIVWTEINQDIHNNLPTLRPRAAWIIDEDYHRTDAQADADWHQATHRLLGGSSTANFAPPLPSPSHQLRAPSPYLAGRLTPSEFAVGEAIHYLTWGLQCKTITAIFQPGEGYNPHDSIDLLYLIARPPFANTDNQPLLVLATLLRKIPSDAPTIPVHVPTGRSLEGRTWIEEAAIIAQGYTTEEDKDDDDNLFSQAWLEDQIAEADMFNIDEMGPTAVDLLVADPTHRVVSRSICS
jgi:hypothetical protein